MSKGVPLKSHPRHHSHITPHLRKPAEYGFHPAVAPVEHLRSSSVGGIPKVHWPCDNAKENKFVDRNLMGSTDQLPPTESNLVPQRKQFAGIKER